MLEEKRDGWINAMGGADQVTAREKAAFLSGAAAALALSVEGISKLGLMATDETLLSFLGTRRLQLTNEILDLTSRAG